MWPINDKFINGHEAFLTALELEFQDAFEGLQTVSKSITSVALPPVRGS